MVKSEKIFDVFFRAKPAMMLVSLHNAKGTVYASSLAKSVDCTYSHVVKTLSHMEREGLILFEKTGRLKLLKLTKKGKDIAEHIDSIKGIF
jgi:predicted transcriptional regulator